MKKLLPLFVIIQFHLNYSISQENTSVGYHDTDCHTIKEMLAYFNSSERKNLNYKVRAIDYQPILLDQEKSILKIKVDEGILPDSMLYESSEIQLLDNGENYDAIAGDSIYTSVDSVETHRFSDDIMWRPNFVRRLKIYKDGDRHIEECQFVAYAITSDRYASIDDLQIKKVNDSIFYNEYVINLISNKTNTDDNFSTQSSMPDVFQNWVLTYDVFNNSGYYLEALYPQTFKDNFQGRHFGSKTFGYSTMNGNLNRGTWDHELNHMIVNSWSTGLFSNASNLSRGHWKGLEEKSSGFGTQCYNGVHDSIYYDNGEVVLSNPDNRSYLAVNKLEKVLWGILPPDSLEYPIRITKNYDNNNCTADSIINIDKNKFQDILTEYKAGRTQGYNEGVIPTIFIVLSNNPISHVGMNVLADAIKRREQYLKDVYFGSNLELDYSIRGDAANYYVDTDNDGFYSDTDCDDEDSTVNILATEIVYNGIDDDCNPLTLDDDLDQDGFLIADDCDDEDSDINPDAIEIPNNGIDEDCDGEDFVSSTHNIDGITIDIFPNPVADNLHIRLSGTLDYKVNIYSVQGKLLFSADNKKQIDVSAFPSGSYLLELIKSGTSSRVVENIVVK